MESPARRSAIPVSKTPTKMRINRALSKSNDGNLNGLPMSDLDMFTMLEENIALKEDKESLANRNNAILQKNIEIERENNRMCKELDLLMRQYNGLQAKLQQVNETTKVEVHERQTLKNINEQQKKMINTLMIKVRDQEISNAQLLEASKQAKIQLEGLVPDTSGRRDTDSVVTATTKGENFTAEAIEQLVNDIGNVRTHLNNTELQLYEANEKISELIESQHILEKENTTLKLENSNLTRVARLMTSSMKESVDTSKKMEVALIKMKKQNDDLVKETKDSLDSPGSPKFITTHETVLQLKEELNQKEVAHSERIVEMSKLMEATIQTNYSEEIQVLQIKLEMVEKELNFAIERAERAEAEVESLRRFSSSKLKSGGGTVTVTDFEKTVAPSHSPTPLPPPPPPPPPPPMPKFNLPPAGINTNGTSLHDSIATFTLTRGNVHHNQQVQATGMDALIAQLRDGSVTLRKNRRKSRNNPALQEMFEIMEISRQQNRSSKMLVDSDITVASPVTTETF